MFLLTRRVIRKTVKSMTCKEMTITVSTVDNQLHRCFATNVDRVTPAAQQKIHVYGTGHFVIHDNGYMELPAHTETRVGRWNPNTMYVFGSYGKVLVGKGLTEMLHTDVGVWRNSISYPLALYGWMRWSIILWWTVPVYYNLDFRKENSELVELTAYDSVVVDVSAKALSTYANVSGRGGSFVGIGDWPSPGGMRFSVSRNVRPVAWPPPESGAD